MEKIVITPRNERQSNLVKSMLKEMRIRFTSHTDENEIEVSTAEIEAIDRGLEEVKNGNVMSHSEAKKIFHDAIYKVEQ
jgi:predicted transcriptional regulator